MLRAIRSVNGERYLLVEVWNLTQEPRSSSAFDYEVSVFLLL